MEKPIVSIIMGSKSDLPTLKHAATVLEEFQIPHEIKIVSAHRTPDLMFDFGKKALSRGIKVIIAGAGGAAHLPGMIASNTVIPIIGVPVKTSSL
ncbi:MAG: 5-(carboxyamino)imidazole ribonucleotide mutase, partial [Dehalococcoidia bacterium]|nr:5-(carboxyamino)imidazole ribonucleotide mutase [Dehalococcoidia bacterium]